VCSSHTPFVSSKERMSAKAILIRVHSYVNCEMYKLITDQLRDYLAEGKYFKSLVLKTLLDDEKEVE